MSTTDHNPEERAFLQARVALFGKAIWALYMLGLLVHFLTLYKEPTVNSTTVLQTTTMLVYLGVWLSCRTGERSVRCSRTVVVGALLFSAVAVSAMGRMLAGKIDLFWYVDPATVAVAGNVV